MFFIHEANCISPQQTFSKDDLLWADENNIKDAVDNIFQAVEPVYEGIPSSVLRRMGRAVRIGTGTAVPLLKNKTPDGVIIATPMGGMEDCVKFLNQIIEYNEGQLSPTNFVQSTPNAIAGQLGLLSKIKGYNITHVHRGLSFENAIIDADMLLTENPGHQYILGAVDEISAYNYNIERLAGWYKKEPCSAKELYTSATPGSIAGEGAAMFIVNNDPVKATAKLNAIHIFHTEDENIVTDQLKQFLQKYLDGKVPDLLLSGENGDSRLLKYYTGCEAILGNTVPVARFKHLSGEHPTVSGFALWLACEIIKTNLVPTTMLKTSAGQDLKTVFIYNNHKGLQHSFILLEKP